MTLEEQFRQIAREEAKAENTELRKEIEILKRVVKQNGDMIDSAEASRRTGIQDVRTLCKRFTPTKQGSRYFFSKVEIETYLAELELSKAPKLHINKEAA